MTVLQTIYRNLLEAHQDHSYSSIAAMNGNGTGGAATSTRTVRRPAVGHNGATFNDDSDRNGSSSASTAFANGNISTATNATPSTNNNNGPIAGKALVSTAQLSFDRGNSIQELKKSLTLDFTNPESAKKSLQTQTPELLSFLRLTSPELEKFLTQGFAQGVSVVQTPTPTQFFFPKNVTTEQEQYARGFLDALNEIYRRSGFIPVNNILSPGFVANTVAQEAKEGSNKETTGPTSTSATSVLPGPSTSSVSFNAALVSNLLAAMSSTPTVPNSCSIPESVFVTTVSANNGVQQFRQTLAAAAAAVTSSHHNQQNSTAFYAVNPRPVAFTNTNTNTNKGTNSILPSNSSLPIINNLKQEPDERCSPSPTTYESRSSSVASSSYPEQHSNFSDVSDAAAALATMNRGGGHHYAANFHTGATSSFMQHNSTQQQFLAAAQLLMSGHTQHQVDHNLSSTASASSTASSTSGASIKMEMGDEHSGGSSLMGHFLPGAIPLDPVHQEKLKLERKRARNRLAATKCRKRKIERIQVLESEVAQVEDTNRRLEDRRNLLVDELIQLRKLIEEHRKAKCNIVLPSSSSLNFTGNSK